MNGVKQEKKLSHNAENKLIENQRRLAIAKEKMQLSMQNEAIIQNTKVKALEIAAKFPHIATDRQEMFALADMIEERLSFDPIEFQEPTKPLDLA